jgi:hypothetical protein
MDRHRIAGEAVMTVSADSQTGLRLRPDWQPVMDDREFQAAGAVLHAYDGMVVAEKSRSWETVKWAAAINVALAIVSIALDKPSAWIVWLTVLVAASAQILVLYCNARMTRFRQEASGIVKYLVGNETDFQGVRHGGKRISWLYDWADLAVWTIILVSSVLLGLAAHSQSI